MKKIIILISVSILMVGEALAFTTFGHQSIAALADKYLTDNAKKEVKAILKTDMVRASFWLNTLRKKPEYAYTKDWHITTLDANGKSTTTAENDGVVQLEKAIDVLRNRTNHSDSLVQASLRTVIHLVGDLHCIAHIRIEGNEATFKYIDMDKASPDIIRKIDEVNGGEWVVPTLEYKGKWIPGKAFDEDEMRKDLQILGIKMD